MSDTEPAKSADPLLITSPRHERPDLSPRSRKFATAALLLLNLTLRLIVALRPLEYIDGVTIPDDAYISLTLSRSIAQGHGPFIGDGWTNGFQPLYVFLMVPAYLLLGPDPVPPVQVALVLLSLFDTLTLYLLLRLVSCYSRSSLSGLVVATIWISNPHGIATTLNGLETAISCFFLVAVLYYFSVLEEGRKYGGWSSFALGSLLGGALWARIDNVALMPAVAIAIFSHAREDLPVSVRRIVLVMLGALLTYVPWLLASVYWTGDLYPISGKAVRLMALANVDFQPDFETQYAVMMKAALHVIAVMNRGTLIAIAAAAIALVISKGHAPPGRRVPYLLLATCWIYALVLCSAYVFYEFGHWYFDRYLAPVGIVLLLTLSVQIDALMVRLPRASQRVRLGASVAAVLLIINIADPRMHTLFFSTETTELGYRNLALWAKRSFPPGTVIGSFQSGALAYFADGLTVFNLDGVVNKECYESLVEGTFLEYIRHKEIQYVLGWDSNIRYMIYRSSTFTPADFGPPKMVSGFRSWRKEWYVLKVNYGTAH